MVRKSKGSRSRTRSKLKKKIKNKFKIAPYLQEFNKDERVVIKPNPSSHRGLPDSVFGGKVGRIIEKRGKSYVVELVIGKKAKSIIARPEHLIQKSK